MPLTYSKKKKTNSQTPPLSSQKDEEASSLKHKQPLPLQPPQTIHIPASLHDSLDSRLTQLPPLLGCFLLATRFGLATPARRDAGQDLPAIMRGEVDEADIAARRLS
jgi:hypothetical protein